MMVQPGPGMGATGVSMAFVFLIQLGFVAVGVIGWIVFLVAAWRMMRAHESLAESARIATEIMETRRSTGA